jgi:putative DNA primase/helicase
VVREYRENFLKRHVPEGAAGEVSRAAARFGLIGGAGEIATRAGITDWPEGEAMAAAGRCFEDWLSIRGTAGGSDVEVVIREVRRFLERHGASRFQVIRHPGEESSADENQVVRDRAGFRRKTESGDSEYLILSEVFRAEVCRGYSYRLVAQILLEREYLDCQPPSFMRKTRLPEIGSAWVYSVRASILHG